jgi:oleandomycin transport system ATP-binding protein
MRIGQPVSALPDVERTWPSAGGGVEARGTPMIEAEDVSRRFGTHPALVAVSLRVGAGEIRGLLGPNGAGKTTLLRILAGLATPSSGRVRVLGRDAASQDRGLRQAIGLVPSGDRSFYLRISGLENLVFFARLHGLRRRQAAARSFEVLQRVGLAEAARAPVGEYSHGMQKRLSVARALLTDPLVLLVDEATHDLDPQGARVVRELVGGLAHAGAAVVWATQRIEEIRGFVNAVTLLDRGEVRFSGTVPELLAEAECRRFLVHLRNGHRTAALGRLGDLLGAAGWVTPALDGSPEHYVLRLADDVVLGDALARFTAGDVQVLSCREARPEIEEAFLRLTGASGS